MIVVRSALFNLWFYGLTIVMGFGGLVCHLLGWRSAVAYARIWARLLLGGLRVICGVSWTLTGTEHLPPTGPALLASMHQSAFDTIIWVLLAPEFSYVLKVELTRVPLFGSLLNRAGMIPVDRRAGMAAMRGLLRESDRAKAEGRQIIIFPEGTRAPPGEHLPLQPGVAAIATRTELPVIPVVTDSGLHWGRRAFRKYPGVIHIAVQPPLPAGLPRAEILGRLEAIFADAPARLASAVDNSVGEPRRQFSKWPSRLE